MYARKSTISLMLYPLLLFGILASILAVPITDFERYMPKRAITMFDTIDELGIEPELPGSMKRERSINEDMAYNTAESNIRKPLIFKRETNIRKPLMFKRYAYRDEPIKMW